MIRVVMSNLGGELDSREARTPREAAEVLAAMAADCGELTDGDTFTVYDDSDCARPEPAAPATLAELMGLQPQRDA